MPRLVPSFSKRESRIEVNSFAHVQPNFTVEAWIAGHRRLMTGISGIVTYRASDQPDSEWYGLLLEITRRPDKGRLRFVLGEGAAVKVDVQSAEHDLSTWANAWHHVAVSYDNANTVLYLDGVAATGDATGGAAFAPSERGLVFGSYMNVRRRRRFKGGMTEVRIWETVRTADQIKKAMFCPLSKDDSSHCLGYWPLDEGKGAIAHDRTTPADDGLFHDIPATWVNASLTPGNFMDDLESGLTVTEADKPVDNKGRSDWGQDVQADAKRTLKIQNPCSHCEVNITKIVVQAAPAGAGKTAADSTDFQISAPANPISLKPKGTSPDSFSTEVKFTPQKVGLRKARVTVTTDRPFYNPFEFTYNLMAEYAPRAELGVTVDPGGVKPTHNGTLNLGTLNQNAERTLVITNSGAGTLDINSVTLGTTSHYTLALQGDPKPTLPVHLLLKKQLIYKLTFTPQGGDGTREADISIGNSGSQDPFKFKVSAEYDAKPVMEVKLGNSLINNGHSESWSRVADQTHKTLTIANTGRDVLNISKITVSNADHFRLTPALASSFQIKAGTTKDLTLTFQARGAQGSHSAAITIESDDPNSPKFVLNVAASLKPDPIAGNYLHISPTSNLKLPVRIVGSGSSYTVYSGWRASISLTIRGNQVTAYVPYKFGAITRSVRCTGTLSPLKDFISMYGHGSDPWGRPFSFNWMWKRN